MSIYVLIPLPTLRGGGKQVGHLKPCLFHRPATDPAGWTTARLSDGDGMTYKYSDIFRIDELNCETSGITHSSPADPGGTARRDSLPWAVPAHGVYRHLSSPAGRQFPPGRPL